MASEQAQWRKFLKPLVGGAVTLMAVAAGYLQYIQKQDTTEIRTRVTALETRADAQDRRSDAQDKRSDKFSQDIDNFKVMLSDIRSDVSFIRGRMESRK